MMLVSNLKHVACVVGGCNSAGFLLTAAFETHKLTDLVGVGSFVAASASLAHRNNLFSNLADVSTFRVKAVNLAVMIWGARLASHLFTRVLKLGDDKRLDKFFRKPGEGYFDSKRSNYPVKLSTFWSIQALWGFLLLLPVTFLNSLPSSSSALSLVASSASPWLKVAYYLPIAGMFASIALETVSDLQKSTYRGDSKNKDHWCDTGLYRFARYPSYFAEMSFWWCVYVSCVPALPMSLRAVGLVSPLFSTFIIMKLSGVPLLEKKNNALYGQNPEYVKYVEGTNLLVPFPKLFAETKNKKA